MTTHIPAMFRCRKPLIGATLAATILVSGCAYKVVADDLGERTYPGFTEEGVATVDVRGKKFRGPIDSSEVRSIQLRAEDGDSITCSLAPVPPLPPYHGFVGLSQGACMQDGKHVFDVSASAGPPLAFSLMPRKAALKIYEGTFDTFTRRMNLTIDDTKYTGQVVGSLDVGAKGVLSSPEGRKLFCELVVIGGYGGGSCFTDAHHRLRLRWKSGVRFHI